MSKPKALAPIESALARLTGARLCYGKPVTTAGRTVITVARVRSIGGGGLGTARGDGNDALSSGGGGGGLLDARPVGFIELSADGTRYVPIDDRRVPLAAIAGGALLTFALTRRVARRRRIRFARKVARSVKAGRPVPELERYVASQRS
jgi:uncharacterized spore protein YtfJ